MDGYKVLFVLLWLVPLNASASPISKQDETKVVKAINGLRTESGESVGGIMVSAERAFGSQFKITDVSSSYDNDMNYIKEGSICYQIKRKNDQFCDIKFKILDDFSSAKLIVDKNDPDDLGHALEIGSTTFITALARAHQLKSSAVTVARTEGLRSCSTFVSRVQAATKAFGNLLPTPAFSKNDQGTWVAAKNLPGISTILMCSGDVLDEFDTVLIDEDQASQIRYSLWITASYMSTRPGLGKEDAFRSVKETQDAAIIDMKQNIIRSGERYGCAINKTGEYAFRYIIRNTTVGISLLPRERSSQSCAPTN